MLQLADDIFIRLTFLFLMLFYFYLFPTPFKLWVVIFSDFHLVLHQFVLKESFPNLKDLVHGGTADGVHALQLSITGLQASFCVEF